MGAPAGDFEKYASVTEEKIYDRPEVIITENLVDFGDEDATHKTEEK